MNSTDWERAFNALPIHLRQRVMQFIDSKDREARIACYGMIETLVSRWSGDHDILASLCYSPAGRPFLPSHCHIDFNVSHSENVAVCAAILDGTVGVDVEFIRPINLDEARAAFSDAVWKGIVESDDPQRSFYRAWTRMEAVAKAEGFGIGGPVQSIRYESDKALVGERQWHVLEIPIDGDYCCHVASSHRMTLADVEECRT